MKLTPTHVNTEKKNFSIQSSTMAQKAQKMIKGLNHKRLYKDVPYHPCLVPLLSHSTCLDAWCVLGWFYCTLRQYCQSHKCSDLELH